MIAFLFDVSLAQTYEAIRAAEDMERHAAIPKCQHQLFSGPHRLITPYEEETLIEWIRQSQISRDCPTPRKVRLWGVEIYKD
jgi:hypothetical protein